VSPVQIRPPLLADVHSAEALLLTSGRSGARREPETCGSPIYLGKYISPESRAEYRWVFADPHPGPAPGAPAPGPRPEPRPAADPSAAEVLLAFLRHAHGYYRRPDGTPTNEVVEFKHTTRAARGLYGHAPAREFDPAALRPVRDRMVGLGWARTTVNNRVRRLRHASKWAAAEGLVPPAVPRPRAAWPASRMGGRPPPSRTRSGRSRPSTCGRPCGSSGPRSGG
jgi:hypothetical protein